MTKKDFYQRMLKSVKDNYDSYSKLKKDYDSLEQNKAAGQYSSKYINETVRPKQYEIMRQLRDLQDNANSEIKSLVNEMRAYLHEQDALNPSDITDDVKLLNCGIKLNKSDIDSMLNRNNDNRTMTQMILRYARENQIEGVKTYYLPAEDQIKSYENMASAAGLVIKWYDNPEGFTSMYSKCLGEGSDMYNFAMSEPSGE